MKSSRKLVVAVLAATLLLLAKAALAEIKVSGYTQARYNIVEDGENAFDLRRVRVKFAGDVNAQGTEFAVQLDLSKLDDAGGSGSVDLKDAWVGHPLSAEWTARLGYYSLEFGYEVPASSSRRLVLERSKAARELFPGERALGLHFMYKPQEPGMPHFVVGYSNGMNAWMNRVGSNPMQGDLRPQTGADFFLARAQWPVGNGGVAGASYFGGSRKFEWEDLNRNEFSEKANVNVLGVHVRYPFDFGLTFQGEYYDGKYVRVRTGREAVVPGVEYTVVNAIQNPNCSGWMAMLEYAVPNSQVTPFYRFDSFDRDGYRHNYDTHAVGLAWDFAKNERITVQWDNLRDDSGDRENKYAIQWQFRY